MSTAPVSPQPDSEQHPQGPVGPPVINPFAQLYARASNIHNAPLRVLAKVGSAIGAGLQGAAEAGSPKLVGAEKAHAELPSVIAKNEGAAAVDAAKVPFIGAQTATEKTKPALIGSETDVNQAKVPLIGAQTVTEGGKPAVQQSVIEKNQADANKAAKGGAPTLGKIDFGAGHVPTAVYDAQGNRHAVNEYNLDPTLAAFVKTANDAYTKATEDQKIRTGIAQDKQRVDLGNKVDSVNAAAGAFHDYQSAFDANAGKMTPAQLSAMSVLISPEKVERSFIDKGISGVLDAVAGQPLTGYSPKVFEGLMTRDQYDALSPQSKQVLTAYFNAIIEHFNTLKNSQGSIPRNPQLIQAELHAIPLPYVDKETGDDAFKRYFGRLEAHNEHLKPYGFKGTEKPAAEPGATEPAATSAVPVKGKLSFKDFLSQQGK